MSRGPRHPERWRLKLSVTIRRDVAAQLRLLAEDQDVSLSSLIDGILGDWLVVKKTAEKMTKTLDIGIIG